MTDYLDTIRRATKDIRDDQTATSFMRRVADLLDEAADSEADYLDGPYGGGGPEPGEEITLAWAIAAAYLGEPEPFAQDGAR